MKISNPVILQVAVWLGIWIVFSIAGFPAERTWHYYVLLTIRVTGFVLFFNVVYYWLLPYYFSGRKKAFIIFSFLAYFGYIGYSVLVDLYLREPLSGREIVEEEKEDRDIPLAFLLFPPIILGMVLFGAAASIRGFSAFEEKKKGEEEANRRRLEAEIALLKSQINPHFLLNTLNNLYALALTEPEKTPDAIYKLSEMVSYILYECASPLVPLKRDIEFVASYIDLQQLRLPPNAALEVDLPENIPAGAEIEPMILIPFIENAFKHGLTTKEPCSIWVSIEVEGSHVMLRVENSIFSPKEEQQGNPSGIGMANTRQRLEHSYSGRYKLHVDDDNGTHQVALDLNLAS